MLQGGEDESISKSLLNLAQGADRRVYRYTGYLLNGWRFNTKERDKQLKSQNSGVFVRGDENTGNKEYFGVLTDIIQLDYPGGNSVILFECDWWDVDRKGKGIKEDRYGFTLININGKLKTNEPYVLATQVEQVYYVKDTKDPNWQVVVKTKPRDLYDLPFDEEVGDMPCQENDEIGFTVMSNALEDDDEVLLNRSEFITSIVERSPMKPDHILASDEEEVSEDENIFLTDEEGIGTSNGDDTDDD